MRIICSYIQINGHTVCGAGCSNALNSVCFHPTKQTKIKQNLLMHINYKFILARVNCVLYSGGSAAGTHTLADFEWREHDLQSHRARRAKQ